MTLFLEEMIAATTQNDNHINHEITIRDVLHITNCLAVPQGP
jgi:hypothetical protein